LNSRCQDFGFLGSAFISPSSQSGTSFASFINWCSYLFQRWRLVLFALPPLIH